MTWARILPPSGIRTNDPRISSAE